MRWAMYLKNYKALQRHSDLLVQGCPDLPADILLAF